MNDWQDEEDDEQEFEASLRPTTNSKIRNIIGGKIGNSHHNESPKIIGITNEDHFSDNGARKTGIPCDQGRSELLPQELSN